MTDSRPSSDGIGDWDFNRQIHPGDPFETRLADAKRLGTALKGSPPALTSDATTRGGGANAARAVLARDVAATGTRDAPRPDGIDEVVAATVASVQAMKEQAETTLRDAQADASADQKAFIARMEAARDAAKAQMEQATDQAYEKLKQIGQEHPEAQSLIVQAMGEVASVMQQGTSAIEGSFNGAISVAQDALDAIKNAGETVGDGVVTAATTIASGLESVFSGW